MITTSDPFFTFFPHYCTCLQNKDLPSLTNGIASSFGMTQFSLNEGYLTIIFAPNMDRAMPPSLRKVAKKSDPIEKFLILPVLLDISHCISNGNSSFTFVSKSTAIWLISLFRGFKGKGFNLFYL